MIEDLEFLTYLTICPNEYGIYIFDQKNNKTLYKQTLKIEHNKNSVDSNILKDFLEKNIFKIEKLIGKFIENIFVVLENNKIMRIDFSIKKKNYGDLINQQIIDNALVDAKDLLKENHINTKIMHMIVENYLVNNNKHSLFDKNLTGNNFCLEVKFLCISNNLSSNIEKVLEKYHIKVSQYFDGNYIKSLFRDDKIEISEMTFRVQNGFNANEVKLIPKNQKKKGFFEKFFQLFN